MLLIIKKNMNWLHKIIPNDKRILLLIIILSLVNPLHYLILTYYPPEGKVFVGYQDDGLMLTLMKSSSTNFDDPWAFDGGKVWNNPLIGSAYLFIILGIIPTVFNLSYYISFIVFKFIFAFLYYIVVYNLIKLLVENPRSQKIVFILFCLAAGLGGILYGAFTVLGQGSNSSIIGYGLTNEFDELAGSSHSLTHTFRLYYVIPEMLGYLSLILFIKNKKWLSGLSLGLTFLFYPMFGIGFLFVIFLYTFVKSINAGPKEAFDEGIKAIVKPFLVVLIFLIPWAVHYSQKPYYFQITKLVFDSSSPMNLLIGSFFMFGLCILYVSRKIAGKKITFLYIVSLIVFALQHLFSTAQTSESFKIWLQQTNIWGFAQGLYGLSVYITIAVGAITILLIAKTLKSKVSQTEKFLLVWLLLAIFVSGIYPDTISRILFTGKFAPFILLPLSIIGGFFIASSFSKKTQTLIIIAIVILSLPSIVGYNLWLQKSVRQAGVDGVLTQGEYDALLFIKGQPDGTVMASLRYNSFIPFYTNKKAILFSGRGYDGELIERKSDIETFYSIGPEVARKKLIKKYDIKYVIFGTNEAEISNNTLNLENSQLFEKVFEKGVKVFRIKQI